MTTAKPNPDLSEQIEFLTKLAAGIFDALRVGNWQRGGGKGEPPEPYLPGVESWMEGVRQFEHVDYENPDATTADAGSEGLSPELKTVLDERAGKYDGVFRETVEKGAFSETLLRLVVGHVRDALAGANWRILAGRINEPDHEGVLVMDCDQRVYEWREKNSGAWFDLNDPDARPKSWGVLRDHFGPLTVFTRWDGSSEEVPMSTA